MVIRGGAHSRRFRGHVATYVRQNMSTAIEPLLDLCTPPAVEWASGRPVSVSLIRRSRSNSSSSSSSLFVRPAGGIAGSAVWLAHSKAYAQAEWSESGKQWLAPTSRVLAPMGAAGDTMEVAISFDLADAVFEVYCVSDGSA